MAQDDDRNMHVYLLPFGWGTGWLFTIGFAHLGFWKAALGLVLWPMYLGAALS